MEPKRNLLLFLKLSAAGILAAWACVWILKPTQLWKRSWHAAEDRAGSTFFGETGLDVLVLCLPILAAAALIYAYLSINSSQGRFREIIIAKVMTNFSQPIIIRSPIGILTLGELLALIFFIIFLAWTYYSNVSSDWKKMTPSKALKLNRKQLKVMSLGVRFGSLSEACLAVLLLPILRGMALLRILGIQFEASVRYHIWIANGMMLFSLLHGAIIMSVWYEKSILLKEITMWQRTGRVYLAGAATLIIGIIIWITSLPPIRRNHFNLFFSAHHLYLLFILFFLLHAGDRHFYLVFSGVLLFALDKILRLIQSSRAISLLSARILPGRAVELTLRKHHSLKYTPTSILFVKIPSISKFQWHPFSIISSSNADDEKLSILVKCQGQWTNSLHGMIESIANKASADVRSLLVSVEGPYGPENSPYKRYDRLVLVAGGSGITPFLSILQDVASRNHSLNQCAAKIHLIYAVKKSEDLSMLTPISSLLLDQPSKLSQTAHFKLNIYVTQEQGSSSSAIELINSMCQAKAFMLEQKSSADIMPGPEGLMCRATITGLAFIVFLISILCLTRAFIHQGQKPSKDKTPSWVYDLLVICSFFIATTCITVAMVVSRWRISAKYSNELSRKNVNVPVETNISIAQGMNQGYEVNFGRRPNLIDLLSEEPVETGETNVGLFVCGPVSMQELVASFCRKHSKSTKLSKDGRKKKCSFVYHAINFSL